MQNLQCQLKKQNLKGKNIEILQVKVEQVKEGNSPEVAVVNFTKLKKQTAGMKNNQKEREQRKMNRVLETYEVPQSAKNCTLR